MKPTGKTHKKAKKIQDGNNYMPQACIYLLTNLTNGKRYVGQYKDVLTVERRWYRHIYAAFNTSDPRPLYCAIRKVYRESKGKTLGFSAEVIWQGVATIKILDAKETHYINKLRSFINDPKGDCSYNLTKGGRSGILGFKFSEESKKHLSKVQTLRWANLEVRERASEVQLQSYAENPERRKNQSVASSNYWLDQDNRDAQSAAMRAWYARDPTAYELISAHGKRRWAKQEERDRQSATQLRSYAEKPERHAQQSAGTSRRYEDPTEREKQRVIQNKRFESQAERDKTGAAAKANWAKKTPAERSAIGIKSRDTRRANKAAKAKAAKKK